MPSAASLLTSGRCCGEAFGIRWSILMEVLIDRNDMRCHNRSMWRSMLW